MSFDLNKSDGTLLVTVNDGITINPGVNSSIAIIGRNVIDYAENIAENHLHMLEHFANDTSNPPSAPITGQLWYDTSIDRFKVYNTSLAWEEVVQVVNDPSPQLGGQLDVNGFAIGDGVNELLTFVEDPSAVNHIEIENESTGAGPIIWAAGDDTNVDLRINPKGTGQVVLDGLRWPSSDGTSGQVVTTDGGGNLSFTSVSSGGLTDVVDDLTPQLGGDLDVNGSAIVSVSNGNIEITPDGIGQVVIDGLSWPATSGSSGQILARTGASSLTFIDNDGATALQDLIDDTSPQLGANLDFNNFAITDGASEEVLIFAGSPGAVNEVTISNAVSGTYPRIRATGDDSNIHLRLDGKGTGAVRLSSLVDVDMLANIHALDAEPLSGGTGGDLTIRAGDGDSGGDGGDLFIEAGEGGTSGGSDGNIVINGLIWPATDGTSGQALVTDGGGNLSFTTVTGLADIVDDTTPQLGGDLDVNGNDIVSVSNGDIRIIPDGSGQIILDGLNWPTSDGTNGQVLTTDGLNNLSFTTISSGGLNDIVEDTTPQLGGNLDLNGFSILGDQSTTNSDISLIPNGTGRVTFNSEYSFPNADTAIAGQSLVSDAAGNITFETRISELFDDPAPVLGGNLDVGDYSIVSSSNNMIDIAPNGTGRLILDGFNFPKQDSEDGSPGQALITDGTGNLFFDTVLTELIEDPSPTIKPGSTLDIGGNLITDVGIIEGSNNNEVLSLIDTSSAVNYLEIANNVTGSGVSVRPNGADTNVRLSLRGKGTGSLRLQSTLDLRSTSTTYNFTFLDAIGGADGRDVSFLGPDGDGSGAGGEMRIIAGSGGETGDGGDVHIHSGVGGSVNGDGGDLHFHAGSVPSGGEGDGGNVRIFGGDAAGTDRIGGDVRIWAGQSTGSGALGTVQILDTELNIITEFVEVPSAVNNIENENAATGSGPTIRSTGADTNVDLNLESSGTGNVTPNRLVVPSGDTASRPSSPVVGQHYFDTDVNMPIWFNGSVWVDALGVTVT